MLTRSSRGEMLAVGEMRAVCENYPAEIDRLDFFVIAATLLEKQRPRSAQSLTISFSV